MTGGSALVLGGGGVTGVAWELGILAGLAEAGADLSDADVVIGTSAGAVVGALVATGTPVRELYDAQVEVAVAEEAAPEGVAESVPEMGWKVGLRLAGYLLMPGGSRFRRARLGRAALRAPTVDPSVRVEVIRKALGDRDWPPARRLLVTAVDADTGRFTVLDKDSGADLVHAVAASCAVPLIWPPVPVNGRRYIDGGMRSPANVDLARGAERVVVLAPLTQSFSRVSRPARQLEALGTGVRSVLVSPDEQSLRAIGKNVLDPANRAPAARAGRVQGLALADRVRRVCAG